MTNAIHTPGPWDGSERNAVTAAKGEIGVAILEPLKHFWGNAVVVDDFRTMEANARLIAAAPDLLVTAQLALAALDVAIDNCTWKLGLHLVAAEQAAAQMRAAIAKARGG